MKIDKKISLFLQSVKASKTGEQQIRVRVRWSGNVLQMNVGHSVNPKDWLSDVGLCAKKIKNSKGVSGAQINRDIDKTIELLEDCFKAFEVNEEIPNRESLRNALDIKFGKVENVESESVQTLFGQYMIERSKKASWEKSTIAKHSTMKRLLNEFNPDLKISLFGAKVLYDFHSFLVKRGMQNSSIKRDLGFVKAFLSWCEKNKKLETDWKLFEPEIKQVRNKVVVFLSWDELMKVYGLKLPKNKKYLERVRDCFCFLCFTGIRYSDLATLKRTDIYDEYIRVCTEKTDTELRIDLREFGIR